MFKLIILSQIGANRYQNIILEILLLSPLWSTVQCNGSKKNTIRGSKYDAFDGPDCRLLKGTILHFEANCLN